MGFYLWFTNRRLGNLLPEDNVQGEIADSAGELGLLFTSFMVATAAGIINLRSWYWINNWLVAGANCSGGDDNFNNWSCSAV